MRVVVLGTGSSGNAVFVATEGARLLVDAGIGPRQLEARFEALGEAVPDRLDAIVATHEHGDHFGQAERLARRFRAPVYAHDGILAPRVRRKVEVRRYEPGVSFRVGDVEITPERVPHDVPQVAIRLATPKAALGVATDVGHVTPTLVRLLAGCDAVVVEANHCRELLATGPYPPRLKARVAGPLGHLSNDECRELAARLVGSRVSKLFLAHLSRTNNTPALARETVADGAHGMTVEALEHGSSRAFSVASGRPFQLGLPFAG